MYVNTFSTEIYHEMCCILFNLHWIQILFTLVQKLRNKRNISFLFTHFVLNLQLNSYRRMYCLFFILLFCFGIKHTRAGPRRFINSPHKYLPHASQLFLFSFLVYFFIMSGPDSFCSVHNTLRHLHSL